MTHLFLKYRRGYGFDVIVSEVENGTAVSHSRRVVATVGAVALALFIADASRELAELANQSNPINPIRAVLGMARKIGS